MELCYICYIGVEGGLCCSTHNVKWLTIGSIEAEIIDSMQFSLKHFYKRHTSIKESTEMTFRLLICCTV